MSERLYWLWIQLSRNPVYKTFIRRTLFTLIFVAGVAGVAIYAQSSKNSKELAVERKISRVKSDGSLMSAFDYAFAVNEPEGYREAYFDTEVSSNANDTLPETIKKLTQRIKIAEKFDEVAVTVEHKQLASKLLLTDLIQREILSLNQRVDDIAGANELVSNSEKLKTSSDSLTRELAAVGKVVGEVRKLSLVSTPEVRKEKLVSTASVLREEAANFLNSRLVAKRLVELLNVVWQTMPRQEAVTLAEAYCEGFANSRYEWIVDSMKQMRKVLSSNEKNN